MTIQLRGKPNDSFPRHLSNSRPRILFIVDHPNWAHDFKTQNLARVLGDDYDIQKSYQDEVTASDLDRADLILLYYWLQFEALKPLASAFKRNSKKILAGICSNWELEAERREPGLTMLREFSRALFVNNLFLYREYQPVFDIPVFYTPNGVDTSFFHPAIEKKSTPHLRVGWAGSLTNREPGYRGFHEFIVPAVSSLDGLEIVSAAWEERQRSPEEMRDFYQSLDIYICASRTEGTPNPCLEAAACGVPLLTTRVGNMPELVLHGVNSLFIEADTDDIIRKLRSLRDSLALRSFLGQQLSRDIQSWDWSIRAQPYGQMFAEMLNGKTSEVRTIQNTAPLIPNVAEPLRSRPLAASVEGQQVREALRQKAAANLSHLPDDFISKHQELELTVVMLSYGRLNRTLNAINALKDNVHIPFKLVLVDNNSGDEVQAKLTEVCSENSFIELFLLNKNLGCAGGRMYALGRVETEYVMFLDNDVEVLPGAVEHLLHSLEQHPELVAAGGKVVFPDGSIHLCGADYWIKDEVLFYELLAAGKQFDDPLVGASGFCKWVSGTATLFRRSALTKQGLGLAMRAYYEDLEWCFRMNKAGLGSFYRNIDSLVIHYHQSAFPDISLAQSERRRQSMKYIETIAHFYKIHGKIVQNIFDFVPELRPPTEELVISAARMFLELVISRGAEWVVEKWNRNELDSLFAATRVVAQSAQLANQSRQLLAQADQLAAQSLQLADTQEKFIGSTNCVTELTAQAIENDRTIESLRGQVVKSEQLAQEFMTNLREREQSIEILLMQVTEKQESVEGLASQLSILEAELKRMSNTLGWRLLSSYGKIKYRYLLPVYRLIRHKNAEDKLGDKRKENTEPSAG